MQALVLRNGTAAMFGKRGCAMLFTRPLCVRRIAQELTREEEDQVKPLHIKSHCQLFQANVSTRKSNHFSYQNEQP